MASNNSRAHVSIVLDGVQAQRILDALATEAKKVNAEIEKLKAENKIDTKEYAELLKVQKQITGEIKKNSKQMSDLDDVMKNLATQTGRQLDAALRTINRVMKDVNASTDEGRQKMEDLRNKYSAISQQSKRMAIDYVDVKKAVQDLGNTSTATLEKAIRQHKEERAQLAPTTAAYKQMTKEIEAMNREIDSRNGKMTGRRAKSIAEGSVVGSLDEIKAAINYFEKLRDSMSLSNTKGLDNVNDKLQKLNVILKATQTAEVDVKDVLQNLSDVSNNTLTKAIELQKRYINTLQQSDPEYKKEVANLQKLNHELDLRNGKITGQRAAQLAAGKVTGSTAELKEALDYYKGLRETLDQTNTKGLDAVDARIAALNQQLGLLSGKLVNVKDVLQNLGTVSNASLTKAAEQQKKYVDSLDQSDPKYKQELANLNAINNALDKRAGKMNIRLADDIAGGKVNANADQIKQSIDLFEKLRDKMQLAGNSKGVDNLNKKIGLLRDKLYNTIQSQRDFNATMANLKTAPIEQLRAAEARLVEEIKHAVGEQQDYADKTKQLQQVRAQIQGLTGDFQKQESSLKQVASRLAAYVGVYGAFNFIKGQVTQLIQKNLQFSDTLSDIRKTTLMSEEAVALLSDRLKELDTRTAVIDVQKLAYEAGKLGITGVANVTEFVKAADQVNIALGEQLNGLESITELMKINSVLGTTQQYGIEQSLLKTGSAINYLSQTSTAVGSRMTDFTARLAGISASAHISTGEVLGLSAASDALKQQVEVSATAFNKLISQMFTHTKGVAEAVGIEFDTLKEKLEMGDTMDALLMVLDAVRKKGGLSETGPIMKDLGSDGARLLQVLNAMANNVDFVRDSVNRANKAFREGTSVTNEYNIKNENAAALWERLKNNMEKFFLSAANADWFKDLLSELQDMPKWLDRAAIALRPIQVIIDAIVWSIKNMTTAWVSFISAWTVQKITAGLAGIVVGLFTVEKQAEKTLTKVEAVKKSINQNWVLLGLTVVFTVLSKIADASKKAAEELDSIHEAMAEASKTVQAEGKKMNGVLEEMGDAEDAAFAAQQKLNKATQEYGEKSEQAKTAQKELQNAESDRRTAINNFNTNYSQYLGYQLQETANYIDMAKAIDAVNAKLNMKALLEAKSNNQTQIYGETSKDIVSGYSSSRQAIMDVTDMDESAAAVAMDYIKQHPEEFFKRKDDGKWDTLALTAGYARFARMYNSTGNLDSMFRTIGDYLNKVEDQRQKIKKSDDAFEADIRLNAQKHEASISTNVSSQWQQIKDFVDKTDEDQLNIMRDLDGDARDKRKKQVQAYLDAARLQAEDLQHLTDADSKRRLADLQQAIARSEAYMEKQIISTTPDKPTGGNGNGGPTKGDAMREYNAIISKVETYYQMQRQVVNKAYEDHEINAVERENRLRQIEQDLLKSRIMARKRITEEATEEEWQAEQKRMAGLNEAGEEGVKQLTKIQGVSMQALHDLLKNLLGDSEWDAILRKAEEDETKMQDLRIRRIEAIEKMLLEGNPVGKLAAEYQRSFQELDLWFAKFDKSTGETLKNFNERVMQAIYGLGEQAGSIDLTTPTGIQEGRTRLKQTGIFDSATIDEADDEQIRGFWVKAYKYVEDYKEASRKAAEQSLKEWEKQYALTGDNKQYEDRIKYLELTAKLSEKLEQYGYSEAIALEKKLEIAKQEYLMESNRLNAKKAKAEKDLKEANDMSDDPNMANKKIEAIHAAQEELHQVEEEIRTTLPDLENAVLDAALTFEEFNQRWIASMSDATQQFIDSFIDFRSFYEDKGDYEGGTIWDNVFGTKEDREKAFGDFVDQLKKATRTAIMEKVRQRMSTQMQDRIELAWAKWFGKQKTKAQKDSSEESVGLEEAAGKAKEGIQKAVNDKLLADQKQHNNEEVAENGAKTSKNVGLSLAEAVANCFGELGPIAGAVAVGVVTAVIGSFLTMALNAIGHDSHGNNAAAGAKTKLVSGMLTYDEGNAQTVLGDNGKTYRAVTDYAASGLVTRPTMTTVQGAPALVAEEGPELVVGRETTRALMMDHPNIVRTIIGLEAHKRHHAARRAYAYDEGNASSVFGTTDEQGNNSSLLTPNSSLSDETVQALVVTMAALSEQLSRPIKAEFNMNGKGGAADQIAQGLLNSKRLGDLDSVKRLLGTK